MLTLAGAAGGWLPFGRADNLYVLGAMLIVVGAVIQDVVADAMSTEVVSRVDPAGNARPEDEVRAELGMVQVLGRLALGIGILAVAGLSGWLAQIFGRETVFLLGLIIPAISALGVLLIQSETSERRPIDWRILGGGIGFGLIVLAVALGGLPFAQEVVFLLSMLVICTMLFVVTRELEAKTRRAILFASIIIFAFRATPSVGDGYFWWTLDVLKFDEAFYGSLRQTAAIIAIAAMWTFSKQLTEYSVTRVLFWLAVAGAVLSLPNIGLFFGIHHWTEKFGFGARAIAVIDAAAASPFATAQHDPSAYLIAFYAPEGRRATWFALMASLMNLALVAGQLADQISQPYFRHPTWRIFGAWPAVDHGGAARLHPPNWRDSLVWSARVIKAGIACSAWVSGTALMQTQVAQWRGEFQIERLSLHPDRATRVLAKSVSDREECRDAPFDRR